jgi:hypothetical protein
MHSPKHSPTPCVSRHIQTSQATLGLAVSPARRHWTTLDATRRYVLGEVEGLVPLTGRAGSNPASDTNDHPLEPSGLPLPAKSSRRACPLQLLRDGQGRMRLTRAALRPGPSSPGPWLPARSPRNPVLRAPPHVLEPLVHRFKRDLFTLEGRLLRPQPFDPLPAGAPPARRDQRRCCPSSRARAACAGPSDASRCTLCRLARTPSPGSRASTRRIASRSRESSRRSCSPRTAARSSPGADLAGCLHPVPRCQQWKSKGCPCPLSTTRATPLIIDYTDL